MQTKRRALAVEALVAALLWIGCGSVLAQISTGGIAGTVSDPTGAAIPGAKVSVTNLATNVSWTTTSGSNGDFVFTRLPIGTYALGAEAKGFKKFVQTGITVNVQADVEVNPKLQLGNYRRRLV